MGHRVNNFDEFSEMVVRAQPDEIFGFFLFDSHFESEGVQRFAARNFSWLDELATRTGITFFVPLSKMKDRKEGSEFQNISQRVAGSFGIENKNLPGIILFSHVHEDSAVYLPLSAKDFKVDLDSVTKILRELFALIEDALRENTGNNIQIVLVDIRRRIEALKISNKKSKLIKTIGRGIIQTLIFSFSQLRDLAHTFVGSLGQSVDT
ncbi:MAG: hypothetical protein JWM59_31 [Verrucomicrobiales bacterium]|nr:hypothetical protein [Verrucomicrobiales bacterium]